MTRQQVKEILDRVLTWPPERQADLAEVARLMEARDKSGVRDKPGHDKSCVREN
jgi:hypothetical protein